MSVKRSAPSINRQAELLDHRNPNSRVTGGAGGRNQ
jgi:hypothetical protein